MASAGCEDLKNPRWVFHPEQDPGYRHFVHIAKPFEGAAGSVTPANAAWLADAALLAYWRPAEVDAITAAVGFASEPFNDRGTDAYVITSAEHKWAIVTFRGTQPDQSEDFASDADFLQEKFGAGNVHRGFLRAFRRVEDPLTTRVHALAKAGFRVWFCGHSLGAALATIAAAALRNETSGVCTVGSPRVGDQSFVDDFDANFGGRSARYVNDHDLVTRVPPADFGLLSTYGHVGELRFIDNSGTVSTAPEDEPSFFGSVFGHPLQIRPQFAISRTIALGALSTGAAIAGHVADGLVPESILDHMPKAYACAIRQAATG